MKIFLLFYMCHFAMGLTHCYKTSFLYIYIVYKQSLMTYKAVHIGQPNYLNELVQPYQPVRTLRSSTSALLVIPFVRSDFASDAFSVSAPTLWNNLPQDVRIRSCANQATFKSRLKSHLFSLAFTV